MAKLGDCQFKVTMTFDEWTALQSAVHSALTDDEKWLKDNPDDTFSAKRLHYLKALDERLNCIYGGSSLFEVLVPTE